MIELKHVFYLGLLSDFVFETNNNLMKIRNWLI